MEESIIDYLPSEIAKIVNLFDSITQTHIDTLSVAVLSALASLSHARASIDKDTFARPIILYSASFMQSGTGKGTSANTIRKYLLKFKEDELKELEKDREPTSNSTPSPDVFLEGASAEGLEVSLSNNSSPFVFLDELGILIKMSKSDTVKQALIRSLMSIFDSGSFVTRRLKDNKRANLINARSMGLFAASTLGQSNLSNQDIKDMISNGALNRFLVTFGGIKPIPLKDSLTEKEASSVERFAKQFHEIAKDKNYYFSDDAKSFYKTFHEKINSEYLSKIVHQDDGAGLVVRKLTFIQRISAIFQIAQDLNTKQIENTLISQDAVEYAYHFLDFLDRNHFEQIGLYAKSKSGKLSPEQRVMNKLSKSPKGISFRDLQTSLSGVVPTELLKSTLENMSFRKTIKFTDELYFKSK